MKRFITRWIKRISIAAVIIAAIVFFIDRKVTKDAAPYLYSDVRDMPHKKVGLLLGTSKYIASGYVNLFYKFRIEATIALYKAGKIDYVLVSGDNGRKSYNEPELMQEDLIKGGIPPERIFLDYAGFRTLDSIVRCKEIFGETDITIISQQFHNERALFLAQSKGLDAIAFNAKGVSTRTGLKVYIREYFARVKMVIDLVFNKQPRFYGPGIEIK